MADETLYLATGETPARLDRWWIDRIFSEGVSDVQAGDFAVTERAQGANLSVDVAAGEAIVAGSTIADQGKYLTRQTAGVNVELEAPPLSDSRIDLIVRRVRDSSATGADASNDGSATEPVSGVAASSPVAPDVPDDAVALAEVVVAAGVSSVTDSDITDRRVQLNATTLKVGTEFTSLSTAERDALSGSELFEGRTIYNTTEGRLELYDGTDWVSPGKATDVQTFTTSDAWTRPTGAVSVRAFVWGAGGGGTSGKSGGGGGGGGACTVRDFRAADLDASVSVTIGAGGAGGAYGAGSAPGGDGGASLFGGCLAGGGGGGADSSAGAGGGTGASAVAGVAGGPGAGTGVGGGGGGGTSGSAEYGGAGGNHGSLYGGGGGGRGAASGAGADGGSTGTIDIGGGGSGGSAGSDGGNGGTGSGGGGGGGGDPAGSGGNGGPRGGGGGGGGGENAVTTSTNRGGGGDGGRGEVVVVTYF